MQNKNVSCGEKNMNYIALLSSIVLTMYTLNDLKNTEPKRGIIFLCETISCICWGMVALMLLVSFIV